jgi:cellulose biosynthesis protein BcsQ
MASNNQRTPQVSTKLPLFVDSNSFICHLCTPNLKLPIPRRHSKKKSKRKSKCAAKGSILRYRIGREAIKPPRSTHKTLQMNLILTLRCGISMPP